MAGPIKIGLGEITDVNISNFGMLTGGAGPGSTAYDRALSGLISKGGEELKGVSDPLEKIFSAVSQHVQGFGLTGTLASEHSRIGQAINEGREISGFNKQFHQSLDYGKTARETSLAAPVAPIVKKTSPIRKDLYHGAGPLDQLDSGTIDPIKHSSGRTPLPAFTLGEKNVAESYAKSGGVGGVRSFSGPLYKMGLEFDSPERIVGAYDLAGNDFIDFMRGTLPEQGMSPPLIPGGAPRTSNFRNIFDESLTNLKPEDKTVYGIMDIVGNIHDKYRPLGEYDYLPRGQGSIEARRFGIDALTWNDHGDEVLGLLDPDDIRSNVGRKNIKSIQEINYGSPADTVDTKIKANISYLKNPAHNPDMIVGGAEHMIQSVHPDTGEVMGQMTFWGHDSVVPGEIDKIDVGEKFRRQGIATQMLEEARRTSEIDSNVPYAVHSTTRTEAGEAWARSTGDSLPARGAGSIAADQTSARVTSGEPLREVPPTAPPRTGLGDIGKPSDIRTRPLPKGSDAASARVTDSGPGRPVIDITTTSPKPKAPPSVASPTPEPAAASARIASNPSAPVVEAVNQPGGVKRMQKITKKLTDDGMQTAKNLASGNARSMGIAGAAALLGMGAYASRNRSQEDIQAKLNRQRYGEM